jgi:hypothetical protein
MSGPLPDPKRRRRNAPTIPTTELPASGPEVDPPEVPEAYELHAAGREWWGWAWRLPQACAWDDGSLYVAARRAQLEDDLVVLDDAEGFNVEDILGSFDADLKGEIELGKHVEFLIRKLRSLAGGRLQVMKEMRELDNKLGLNPEALAKLRWTIVDEDGEQEVPAPRAAASGKRSSRRGRLELVAS